MPVFYAFTFVHCTAFYSPQLNPVGRLLLRLTIGVGVERPSRGDPVKGWKIMGCSVRSDNLF